MINLYLVYIPSNYISKFHLTLPFSVLKVAKVSIYYSEIAN